MKMNDFSKRALRTCVESALLYHAWPKFLMEYAANEAGWVADGEFRIPVGHLDNNRFSDDVFLCVEIGIEGELWQHHLDVKVGPEEELAFQLVQKFSNEFHELTEKKQSVQVTGFACTPYECFYMTASIHVYLFDPFLNFCNDDDFCDDDDPYD